jgi:Flp pilus assembly protein TadG
VTRRRRQAGEAQRRERWGTSRRRPVAAESGQLTLLVIGFAVILFGLVAVVVDASQAVLLRRSLASLADGAALAAVQAASERALYTQGAGAWLPLDPAGAQAAVVDYLATSQAQVDQAWLVDVSVAAGRVTVVLAAPLDLPLTGTVTGAFDGTTVTASASATAPVG